MSGQGSIRRLREFDVRPNRESALDARCGFLDFLSQTLHGEPLPSV